MIQNIIKIQRRTKRTPTILIQPNGQCISPFTNVKKEKPLIFKNCTGNNEDLKLSFKDKINFFESLSKQKDTELPVNNKHKKPFKVETTVCITRTFDFALLKNKWEALSLSK
ncbi:hypothetical protein AAJ76_1000189180 [Vairimorpha ceranae]|uniref:Uncharacterized protein n=1 Tax=Vairimorpha ceranae TaxID=40302 RepID=A0A0F9WHF5_9MICR|nr:hypothetical protein AAJ76_1000189180 [Vairimorpha ceranae]KKO76731.1 hypothetical protein AAJ76_1000189180 [Vairimorpha ceranae]